MKKNLLTLVLLITAVCWSNNAFAQPANNECSGAAPIAGFPGNPLIYGAYDNSEATSEASDPADPGFPDSSIDNTTWYTLIGDGNTYFIYTSHECGVFSLTDTYITDGDTQMAIYSGGCDALELVALSEDNLHAPGYDLAGVFPAGIVLDTEAGVEYSIMIDGYLGAAGEFCIVVEDWVCGANIELAEDQETSIDLCVGDTADIGVNEATLDFGGASIGLGLNSGIVWVMTGENPMGEHPAFVDSYLGFVGSDFGFEGDASGTDPFFGLGCIWVTPITVAEVTGAGSAFLSSGCQAVSGESIEICFLPDGDENCGDNCGEANVDLSEDTPLVIDLCPEDMSAINFDEATVNYGSLVGDNPDAIWVVNTVDPMGDPLGSPGSLSLPFELFGDGIPDTLWVTITLVENLNEDGTIDWICRPLSETVRVTWYAEGDPACDVVACDIAEGDVGELSSVGETTVCAGDGVADIVDFTTSGTPGEGASYGYLITTDTGEILSPGVVEGMTLSQDFDGAGTGVCLVWGVIWEGDVASAFVQGENAFDIAGNLPDDACIDTTEPIEITREECLDPLATGDAGTAVDGDAYTVSFDIEGGSGDYSANGGTIDGNNTFTSDAIDCGTSYSFTITDNNTGEQINVEGDAPCAASACPITLVIEEVCSGDEGGTVFVTVIGGVAPYNVVGTLTDVSDDNTFEFPSPENETYEIEVMDDSGCDAVVATGVLTCSKCKNEAGTLSTDGNAAAACGANGSVAVSVSNGFVDTNPENPDISASVRNFILHTDAGDPEGSLVAINDDGIFTRSNAGGAGTYYVTTVVGPDANNDGIVDSYDFLGLFGNECSFGSDPLAVVFADETELQVTAEENCNQDTETVTVTVSVVGGAEGATYDVTGTFEATGQGSTFSFSGVADGEIYTVNVTEVGGCGVGSLVSEPVICQKEDAVEWLSFEGEVQAQGNFLVWATASETNNEYFSVERSLDGKNFVEIAKVNAVGESFTATSYDYLDRTASAGVNYYRITQYDFDGQNDATNVISLTRGEGSFGIANIRPVPAADYIEVAFTAISNGSVELTVYDMTGRVMLQSNVDATTGINTRSIDVSTYPAGVYMISVNNGTEVATQRLVKE